MEDILYYNDLHDPIEGNSAKPKGKSRKEWKNKNRKAIGYIKQCVDLSVFHHVSHETNVQILWKKFECLYKRKTARNKNFAIRNFVNLNLKLGKPISKYLSDFQYVVNQLITMKIMIDDELQVLLFLSFLSDICDTLGSVTL